MPTPTVTFATLKSRCLSYGYGTVDETNFGVWLNQAYANLANQFRWSWLEKSSTVSTTANQQTTTVPADMKWFGRFGQRETASLIPEYLSALDFRKYMPHRGYNTLPMMPKYFSLFDDKFWWWPTPDAVYTWDIFYWQTISPLVNGTDVSLVPDEYADVLVLGALERAAMRENDMGKYQIYSTQFIAMTNQMMRNEKAKQSNSISRVKMPDHYRGAYDPDTRKSTT